MGAQQSMSQSESEKASSISACLILKNEARFLVRRPDSGDGQAEEIIVVDFGSLDHRLDIARRYTDKIYQYLGSSI